MDKREDNYEKIIGLLRSSRPELHGVENIRDDVVSRIRDMERQRLSVTELIGYLFRWTDIAWCRRSLLAITAVLLVFFIHQQTVIIQGLRELDERTIPAGLNKAGTPTDHNGTYLDRMIFLRITGRRYEQDPVHLTAEEIEELARSYDDINRKYTDLMNILDGNPELKKQLEEELEKLRRKGSEI